MGSRSWWTINILTFCEASFTLSKIWNQHKCTLTSKWIKKTFCIHRIEYCLALERKEIQPLLRTCKTLYSIKHIHHRSANTTHIKLYEVGETWSLESNFLRIVKKITRSHYLMGPKFRQCKEEVLEVCCLKHYTFKF